MIHIFSHNDPVSLIATKLYLKARPETVFNPKVDIVNFLSEIKLAEGAINVIVGLSVNPKQLYNPAQESVDWITPFTNGTTEADLANGTIYSGTSQDYNDCLSIVEEILEVTLRDKGGQSISQALFQINNLTANGNQQVLDVAIKLAQNKIPAQINDNYVIMSWGTMPVKKEELQKQMKTLTLNGFTVAVTDNHMSYDEAKILTTTDLEGLLYFDFKLTGKSLVKFVFKSNEARDGVLEYLEDHQFTGFKVTNTSGYALLPLSWYNILLDD